jgi:hypothetical protein
MPLMNHAPQCASVVVINMVQHGAMEGLSHVQPHERMMHEKGHRP